MKVGRILFAVLAVVASGASFAGPTAAPPAYAALQTDPSSVFTGEPAANLAELCTHLSPASIEVVSAVEALQHDHSKSMLELSGDGSNGVALGFTDRIYHYDVEAKPIKGDPIGAGGLTCFGMDARVQLIMRRPVIFVASELSEDSCGYQLVMAHERKHLELALHYFPIMKAEVERRLGAAARKAPLRFANESQAQQALNAFVEAVVKEAVQAVYLAEAAEQDAIDNEEEILAVVKGLRRCGNVAKAD